MAAGERFDRASGTEPFKPETRALEPHSIVIDPDWNPRDMVKEDTRSHIDTLKASILQRAQDGLPGLYNPIEVTYDRTTGVSTLVDGQCRLTACRELWDEGHYIYVPAVRIDGTVDQLIASTMTANSGLALSQWEIGVKCRTLVVGYNWSVKRVAAHICKSVRYVNEAIQLAALPTEAKEMLSEGVVTAPRLLSEVKEHGPVEAVAVLREAVAAQVEPTPTGVEAKRPKPLKRDKAPSAKEVAFKAMAPVESKSLDCMAHADILAKGVLDDECAISDLWRMAKAYLKCRGLQ